MAHDYAIYDVFTDTRLAGNGLAVVFDAEGLDDASMQALAREFNLSETVFVLAPEKPAHTARIRIFTPGRELPFAGHPTVGCAIAIAERDGGPANDRIMVLEEMIGPVRCALNGEGIPYAEFDLPRKPEMLDLELDKSGLAAALSVNEKFIGFENHVPSVWQNGNAFAFVPVNGLGPMANIRIRTDILDDVLTFDDIPPVEVYAYSRDTVNHDCAFHARMFAPHMGIAEDPATGSAVAGLAGVIRHFDGLAEGPNEYWIEQGIEMGRPSRIRLEITGRNGEIASARIGGNAVRVASGKLDL